MIQRGLTTPAVVPPATRNWAGRSRSRRPVKVLVPEAAAAAGDHLSARSTLYSRISALLLYGQDNSARSQGTLSCGACPTMRTGFDTAPIAESTAGRGLGLTLGPIAIKAPPNSAATTPTRITLAGARALPSWLKISSLRVSFEFPSMYMASPALAAPFYNAESAR
jgi:hypothetical protein